MLKPIYGENENENRIAESYKEISRPGKKKSGEVTAVDNLTLEIPDGELVGLLGPSGCGKSTTLNLICGLEKPSGGRIFFGEEDVTDLSPELRGRGHGISELRPLSSSKRAAEYPVSPGEPERKGETF